MTPQKLLRHWRRDILAQVSLRIVNQRDLSRPIEKAQIVNQI